jgi:polyisoprenoid-binding protein YceI
MLRPSRSWPLLLVLAAAAADAQPQRYELDPNHSFVYFELLHFGTSTRRGRFAGVGGEVTIDPAAGTGYLGLRIATATADTGVRLLDARLRDSDLLASRAYPYAYFVATHFRFEHATPVEVRGEFTLRGISQPLSLHALRYACRHDEKTKIEVCGGDFEADFDRSEFGITFALPFVADRVHLLVSAEGRRR